MILHIVSGSLILLITGIMGILALQKMGWSISNNIHSILGVSLFGFVSFVVMGGAIARYSLLNYRWKSSISLMFRLIHRFFGHTMIALAQFNIFYGVQVYFDFYGTSSSLGKIHLFGFAVLFCILETLH